ncbi:hypothetical protein [Mesorhizobium sp. M0140]|uniref:hypothetical protein n=1 Tax=Mesorhizobium sp. M0140 TaxID=2956893 RepID=UPI0033354429
MVGEKHEVFMIFRCLDDGCAAIFLNPVFSQRSQRMSRSGLMLPDAFHLRGWKLHFDGAGKLPASSGAHYPQIASDLMCKKQTLL